MGMNSVKIAVSVATLVCSMTSANGQSTHDPSRPEAIPIVIRLEGFEQQKISLPSGKYLLAILNRSGLKGLELALERMPGNSISGTPAQQLLDAAADPLKGRLLQNVVLAAGTYRLREVHHNHPAWVVEIQIK
jgi:hypothetical protein